VKRLALDLDGTLISCEPRQSAVLRAVSAPHPVNVPPDTVWSLKRDGLNTRDALIQTGIDPTLATCIAHDWQRQIEDPVWLGLDTVLPGVESTLARWKQLGWQLVVLTARSRREWVRPQTTRLGLDRWIDAVEVVPPGDAAAHKAAFLRQHEFIGFIGDTESDHAAAATAGIPFIGVASGQRSLQHLRRCGLRDVVTDVAAAAERWPTMFIGANPA